MNIFELVPEIEEQMGSIDSIIDEIYPHISKKLVFLWGSRECLEELEGLVNYDYTKERPMRQGFTLHALKELNIIMESHLRQFPYIKSNYWHRKNDPWSN